MDAPPIPRLVDLVHAFNGVVVEQFKKRVERLLSDSIPLWRLLKLLFKILHPMTEGYSQNSLLKAALDESYSFSKEINFNYFLHFEFSSELFNFYSLEKIIQKRVEQFLKRNAYKYTTKMDFLLFMYTKQTWKLLLEIS